MSSIFGKGSGGVNPNQTENSHATSSLNSQSTGYRSKLRPRPTKQTVPFESLNTISRKKFTSDQSRTNLEIKPKPEVKKRTTTGTSRDTSTATKKSVEYKKVKPLKRKISQSDKAQTESPKVIKLASSSSCSDELSKPETSKGRSETSKRSQSAKLKSSSKPKLPHKSKSETRSNLKSESFSAAKKGKIRKWQEKYLTSRHSNSASSSAANNSKTGSCVSSRRGSERGKSSSGGARSRSSSLRAPEEPCNDDTATTSHRQLRGSKTGKQNEVQSTSNDTASTSRSTSRTNESESSTMSNNGAAANTNGSEEDNDLTRIQALLEARGLPPHFFGSLGPRMQQILHRSMGAGTNSKAQQYLQSIQDTSDESRQLQGAINMCQLLVMGNEDTLIGFPVKNTVPALIALLQKEHNFDLMNHACRALTYMMEALPRSSYVVVDAIPVFLEKLQSIQCMDVAEQSLTALETLSRRHAQAIIQAGGFAACLVYIDFFSLPAQRSAINIAANCSLALGSITSEPDGSLKEYENLVKSSISILSNRLLQHDKKCVESSAQCIVHLIDAYHHDHKILESIAETDVIENLRQLLVITRSMLSSNTFVNVLRVITILCSCLVKVASNLIDNNIAETIKYLLCGTVEDNGTTELTPRLPQELYELTSLICKLLPKLPEDNELFAINSSLWQTENGKAWNTYDRLSNLDQAIWQWRDENGQWRSYFRHDSRLIEAAYLGNEGDVSVSIMESSYTIDFEAMQQMNEDSGTTRAVQRTVVNTVNKTKQKPVRSSSSSSIETTTSQSKTSLASTKVEYNKKSLSEFIKTLFTVLYEVYNSSAGSPSVRHRCLQSLLSMVHYSDDEVLKEMLESLSVSSHISSMLCSPDICITVGALQMAEMLMEKLPDIFRNYFLREGVVHQVKKIVDGEHHGVNKPEAISPPIKDRQKRKSSEKLKSTQKPPPVSVRAKTTSSLTKGNKNATKDKSPESKKSPNSSHNTRSSSFLGSFNPSKWGKNLLTFNSSGASSDSNRSSPSSFHFLDHSSERSSSRHSSKSNHAKQHLLINNENKQTIKKWLNKQAVKFITFYFNELSEDGSHKSIDSKVLSELLKIAEDLNCGNDDKTKSLESLRSIITSMDVSSFELQHSGIVKSLLHYLTMNFDEETQNEGFTVANTATKTTVNNNIESPTSSSKILTEKSTCNTHPFEGCEAHARTFLGVFAGIPEATLENQVHIKGTIFLSEKIDPFYEIVRKLNSCVSQLEHLPVKTQDVMSSSAQTLHFFSTRQLKCQLHRNPNCTNVKQWHGGPVRIDPLVQVHAIERYLIARGYGVKTNHKYKNLLPEGYLSCEDEEDNESDESGSNHELLSVSDIVNTVSETATSNSTSSATSSNAAASSHWMESAQSKLNAGGHRLNFFIGNQKLSHDMSVFQAIKQYSTNAHAEENNLLANDLTGNSAIWSKTHIITYELAEPDKQTGKSKNMSQRAVLKKTRQRNSYTKSSKLIDTMWNEGKVPEMASPLRAELVYNLPDSFLAQDPSKDVLCLLRVLNSIARHWYYLYPKYSVYTDKSLVSKTDFINSKIDTKCKRQLQDPLMIMTGQLPQWLRDLANFCPFLLSFDTRMIFFHVTAFDRDHAMQYLLDSGGRLELSSSLGSSSNSSESSRNGASHHLNPRLEKKKCSVSRSELLSQAEKIMNECAHSKAVLEIDYKGEVGTGLGPTLEFFTLASKEIQRDNLKLWRNEKKDEDIKKRSPENKEIISTEEQDYVVALYGLFPQPIGKNIRGTGFAKKRAKFKFLGKLLGKALSDGRMLDITFSEVFYKWLLNMEDSLSDTNLFNVDAGIYQTFSKLKEVASECVKCEQEKDLEALKKVDMDGCPVEDLGLYMVLPGDETFELIKGGKNITVTSENLVQYLDLISYWCLVEGVRKQFEAFREGFESVINPKSLSCFYPEELDQVFCGSKYKQWTMQVLADACVPNHGYTQDNPTVLMLYRILASYEVKEQRNFLQFVTGSPHLPVGGLKSLNPPLTIVRKTCEDKSLDSSLPSVMTCVNYLKLPEYSTEEVMREKLRVAAVEGQNSFLLS